MMALIWQNCSKTYIVENGLFLTLGSGTSSARNENLRPLLITNVSLISRKYGLRNHFSPLESGFLTRKSEKKGHNFLGPLLPILGLTFLELSCNFRQMGYSRSFWYFFRLDGSSGPVCSEADCIWNCAAAVRLNSFKIWRKIDFLNGRVKDNVTFHDTLSIGIILYCASKVCALLISLLLQIHLNSSKCHQISDSRPAHSV